MADKIVQAGFFSGTGTETVPVGMAGITRIEMSHGSSANKPAEGYVYGTSQYARPDFNASAVSGKALQIKNNAGTVVFDATYTGNPGTDITFNKTTNTLGSFTVLFRLSNT